CAWSISRPYGGTLKRAVQAVHRRTRTSACNARGRLEAEQGPRGRFRYTGPMIEKQEVQEIFPTPLWIVDLQPAAAAMLNAQLKSEIERISEPRPKVPPGSNWQTPQDLHTRPAFADFVKLVETAARGVARFLQVDQYPMAITGCWANVNPPGSYHPMHHHPNNYLSGVYYVAVPAPGSQIVFQDPRGHASIIMLKPRPYSKLDT